MTISLKIKENIKFPVELEINVSNVCGAECSICSRYHGSGNKFFMEYPVFNELINQLKDFKFSDKFMFQTSGNGEAFLNVNYLDYIYLLKKHFPQIPRWTYNNFSMWTKDRTDRIVSGNLFSKIHVRIDSLVKEIFERNSNLNQDIVFDNLKYFLSINTQIPVVILYNNIRDYYRKCNRVLHKRPVRDFFSDEQLDLIPLDEEKQIKDYFQHYSKSVELGIFRIDHSLWGERSFAPKDTKTLCPKWNVINNVIWLCPNGDISCCCYDDRQNTFIAGNIMDEHILDIFNGDRRREILYKIKLREYTDYPCINPNCCKMGDKEEIK